MYYMIRISIWSHNSWISSALANLNCSCYNSSFIWICICASASILVANWHSHWNNLFLLFVVAVVVACAADDQSQIAKYQFESLGTGFIESFSNFQLTQIHVCVCMHVCALASHEIFLKSITGFWARLRLVLASPSPRSGPGLAWLGQFQRLQQKVFCFLLTVCSFVVVVFVIVVVVVAFLLYLFVCCLFSGAHWSAAKLRSEKCGWQSSANCLSPSPPLSLSLFTSIVCRRGERVESFYGQL